MKTIHLTEEMLQLVAIEGIEKHPSAEEHLKQCTACQAQVSLFSQLIESLETLPPATFQFNLTSIVMESLPENLTAKQVKRKAFSSTIIVTVVFLSVIILFYLFRKQLLYVSKIPNEITLFLITISGLVLLFLLIADMVREYDKKIEKLNHL